MGHFVNKILPYTRGTYLSSFILTRLMRQAQIIPKNSSIKVTHIGTGTFGEGYLLSNQTTGDNFVLKRFKCTYKNVNLFNHGILAETNNKIGEHVAFVL